MNIRLQFPEISLLNCFMFLNITVLNFCCYFMNNTKTKKLRNPRDIVPLRGPAMGDSRVACLNLKMRRVAVLSNVASLSVVKLKENYLSLSEFKFFQKGCRLPRFYFMCCRYFLGQVACPNLPWQGLL